MATKELRAARHKYKAAYTTYMHCVHALSDASQQGTWPTAELLKLDEQAFNDLVSLRQALLNALYEHTHVHKASAA